MKEIVCKSSLALIDRLILPRLQPGDQLPRILGNRFNGFSRDITERQTVETVLAPNQILVTPS